VRAHLAQVAVVADVVAGARLIRTLLFGVTPTDPAVFGFTLIVIIGGVLAAALVPACRAVRSRR